MTLFPHGLDLSVIIGYCFQQIYHKLRTEMKQEKTKLVVAIEIETALLNSYLKCSGAKCQQKSKQKHGTEKSTCVKRKKTEKTHKIPEKNVIFHMHLP